MSPEISALHSELNNARTLTESTRQDLVKARAERDAINAEIDLVQEQWRNEQDEIASMLGYLAADIQSCEDDGGKYVIYHHDCMSGTSCDACRIFGRISDILGVINRPNTTDGRS